jgi:protein-L-isoaspartate(D-aspartate) O-methyltransferase
MLIDDLIQQGYLKTPEIISAFKKVKREDFVLPEDEKNVEINAPLSIGFGQTISQPLTVAFMIEELQPKVGDKILDVGSGSGWTTALLAQVVKEKGRVYAMEVIPALKDFGKENVAKYNFIKRGVVQFFCADGHKGLPEYAPFDRVLVSAATPEVPQKLLEQLKVGGRLVIPIGRQYEFQDIVVIDKRGEDKFKEKRFPGFVFVPLVKS